MTEFQDDAMRGRLAGFELRRDDGDWQDVARRATRLHRHRVLGAVAIAAAVIVGAASALALSHPIVDFMSAKKAPPYIVKDFGDMNLAPNRNGARTIASVTIGGTPYTLYVAAATGGGFCAIWASAADDDQSASCRQPERVARSQMTELRRRPGPNPLIIEGSFLQRRGAELVAKYADGTSAEIPFIWVTAPIAAGFYAFDVPIDQRGVGHELASITLYDSHDHLLHRDVPELPADGGWVTRRTAGFGWFLVPFDADYSRRQKLYDVRMASGSRLVMWAAPKQGGGRCIWTGSTTVSLAILVGFPDLPGCHIPSSPDFDLGYVDGSGTVFVCCIPGKNARRVDLLFQDGSRRELAPKLGVFLAAIPARNYAAGHRLREVVTRDAAGRVLKKMAMPVHNTGYIYVCTKPANPNRITKCRF